MLPVLIAPEGAKAVYHYRQLCGSCSLRSGTGILTGAPILDSSCGTYTSAAGVPASMMAYFGTEAFVVLSSVTTDINKEKNFFLHRTNLFLNLFPLELLFSLNGSSSYFLTMENFLFFSIILKDSFLELTV